MSFGISVGDVIAVLNLFERVAVGGYFRKHRTATALVSNNEK